MIKADTKEQSAVEIFTHLFPKIVLVRPMNLYTEDVLLGEIISMVLPS